MRRAATLYWIRLRKRWAQELLAVAGLALGVALIYASQVANTSMSGPIRELNRGLVSDSQLQVVARASDGFDAALQQRVEAVDGVVQVTPILQAQAQLAGPRGVRSVTIVASDPRRFQLQGGLLRGLLRGLSSEDTAEQEALALPAPIARAIGVRFGDQARMLIGGRARSVPIAVISRADAGALLHAVIAIAPLRYAQKVTDLRGRLSRLLVQARPSELDRVRTALGAIAAGAPVDVRPADYEERVFAAAAGPTRQSLAVSSTISGLVGFLFAFCALIVTAGARRMLAEGLRLDGWRPAAIVRVMLLDGIVLGLVATAAGLAIGEALSRRGFKADIDFLSGGFPIGDQRIVTATSVAIAAASGLVAALLGVLAPLWSLRRGRDDHEAAATAGAEAGRARPAALRLLIAAALVAASAVAGLLAPRTAIVGLFALGVALVLALPALVDAVVAALSALGGRRRRALVGMELALPQLRDPAGRPRALAIAATGAIAVFGAVGLAGSHANLQDGLNRITHEVTDGADLWVAPPGPGDLFSTMPFASAGLPATLGAVDGVRGVASHRAAMLDVAGWRAWVRATPVVDDRYVPKPEIMHGDPARAEDLIRRGGWAAVSDLLAQRMGVGVGDRFVLPSPRPLTLRVAATTTNMGWGSGAIAMNGDDYVRGWETSNPSGLLLHLQPGASLGAVARGVRAALGPHTGLRVETAAARGGRQRAASREGLARLTQIAILLQVMAVMAMTAAMAGLLWQRQVIVARLKLDGHPTTTLWRALAVESAVLFGTGCLAGALLGLLSQVLLTGWLKAVQGFPVVIVARPGIALVSFLLVIGAAMLVVAVPGYLVARTSPSLRTGE